MTRQSLESEMDGLLARYDDWHECEEYHIHDGTGEHEGSTPLPHDFDDVQFKAALLSQVDKYVEERVIAELEPYTSLQDELDATHFKPCKICAEPSHRCMCDQALMFVGRKANDRIASLRQQVKGGEDEQSK